MDCDDLIPTNVNEANAWHMMLENVKILLVNILGANVTF